MSEQAKCYFPCALMKGHGGSHRAEGTCVKHGHYYGAPSAVPRCPDCAHPQAQPPRLSVPVAPGEFEAEDGRRFPPIESSQPRSMSEYRRMKAQGADVQPPSEPATARAIVLGPEWLPTFIRVMNDGELCISGDRYRAAKFLYDRVINLEQQLAQREERIAKLLKEPRFKEDEHIDRMVAAGCLIDFEKVENTAYGELIIQNRRAEVAEVERDRLQMALAQREERIRELAAQNQRMGAEWHRFAGSMERGSIHQCPTCQKNWACGDPHCDDVRESVCPDCRMSEYRRMKAQGADVQPPQPRNCDTSYVCPDCGTTSPDPIRPCGASGKERCPECHSHGVCHSTCHFACKQQLAQRDSEEYPIGILADYKARAEAAEQQVKELSAQNEKMSGEWHATAMEKRAAETALANEKAVHKQFYPLHKSGLGVHA